MVGLGNNVGAVTQCAKLIKSNFLNDWNFPSPPTSVIKSIQRKVNSNNLCMMKADKGHSLVIMTRNSYDTKMTEFLTNNNAIDVTSKFNFNKFNALVRKHISDSQFIIEKRSKPFLKTFNPRLPRLYGLPKVHRSNCPMRPIVSFTSAPTYNLCKHLNKWLSLIHI